MVPALASTRFITAVSALLSVVFLIPLPGARADPIVGLSFDALQPGEDVLGYYAAGLGSLGSGPGPDLGITFSPGLIVGPPGWCQCAGDGNSAAVGGRIVMDLAAVYAGPVSFYHWGPVGMVDFFSGPGGSGDLVFKLLLQESGIFDPVGHEMPVFRSAVFDLPSSRIDSLTFGAFVIPEPPTAALLATGLVGAGLGLIRPGKENGCEPRKS